MNDTDYILSIFEEINQIPRKSKHEEKVADFLQGKAEKAGFSVYRDQVNNLIISVPASPGREQEPGIVLQGHMDMVCEKNKDSHHDFMKDPIRHKIEGDWLTAKETSLGADNGIGLALGFAAAERADHPPIEILVTVDEETGLNGAHALEKNRLRGTRLLNLDSEDEGVFTIGCAGGMDTRIELPVERESREGGHRISIRIEGLKGGHSGTDINQIRGNALRMAARLADLILSDVSGSRIRLLSGGSAHNAIPRYAEVEAVLPEEAPMSSLFNALENLAVSMKEELEPVESELSIDFSREVLAGEKVLDRESGRALIDLLLTLPHGIDTFSPKLPGFVQTSSNLAVVEMKEDSVLITTSQRSSLVSELEALTRRVWRCGRLAGGKAWNENGYPPWPIRSESPLRDAAVRVFRNLYRKEPVIEAIHAGLECGVIGSLYPEMDMLSLGPTIENAHSPDEKLFLPSIQPVWNFLKALLADRN